MELSHLVSFETCSVSRLIIDNQSSVPPGQIRTQVLYVFRQCSCNVRFFFPCSHTFIFEQFRTGVIITATATSMPRFLGGRFLTGDFLDQSSQVALPTSCFSGFGTLCAATSAKSFLAELVPPQSRGAYLGFLNSLLVSWSLSISQTKCHYSVTTSAKLLPLE